MSRAARMAGASLVALLVWQAVVTLGDLPRFILPGPHRVFATLWASRALIAEHALVTAVEVLVGLGLGAVLGFASAILLVASPLARSLLRPMLVFSQATPVFALAPILTLWLGYGLWSKVAMALLIIYFPVTSAFFRRADAGAARLAGTRPCDERATDPHPLAHPGACRDARFRIRPATGCRLCPHRRDPRRMGRGVRRSRLSHAARQRPRQDRP